MVPGHAAGGDGAPGGAGWWDSAFGGAYSHVYAHRDEAAAAREAAFVVRALGACPAERVLDAGCGAGRHARALAAAGCSVTGMDRSEALLGEAARRAGAVCYVRGDLRRLPFRDSAFGHVVSFFTSFGYFDEPGDRAQLGEFRRVLPARGRLLLDFLNAPRVARTLVPESERQAGDLHVVERRAIRDGRVEKSVEVRERGSVIASWTESVRLWSRDELRGLLGDAGFEVLHELGALGDVAWTPDSDRIVLVGEAA